ncbi:DUF6774 domain-containing protein [Clostridium aminobutyricum]|uniref:DUF6774 domain-containing protein n=1 Tax=Clostridium aminobutyricum TaxID=33953 RepID=A0A939II80_CLOAM|nr:DUF6774 domain-containing protein [Clostridium aminobutyricum]MBN7772796.1 hypothetical protein [Clostridium aminobutyricum]
MNYCELTAAISSLAIVIAKNIPDDDELDLLAATLTQLGDTLATIAAHRSLCESSKTPEHSE